METKDALDIDLAAREGLQKLGYVQEMTRVRVTESSQDSMGQVVNPFISDPWLVPHSFQ